jgi:hypothetical protein
MGRPFPLPPGSAAPDLHAPVSMSSSVDLV